ncbi:hypothetical protein M408DRAFT_102130 [Serendipita vermifera MAFF 305830]|uniref:Uncharacterized protein n=1 Tax=Serendipita vermifera MAFF 305830 TaxID=933852 RepID=A0A0C3AQP9_SERVB|nr:hypothetical protein M408DRAFT_102130 [Serendipita vermifera MAFF 305830]
MREKKGESTLGVMRRAKTWALEEQRVWVLIPGLRWYIASLGTVGGRRWTWGIEKGLYGLMLPVTIMIPRKPPILSLTSPVS